MTPSLPKHIHENLNMALVSSEALLPRATGHAHNTDRDLISCTAPAPGDISILLPNRANVRIP